MEDTENVLRELGSLRDEVRALTRTVGVFAKCLAKEYDEKIDAEGIILPCPICGRDPTIRLEVDEKDTVMIGNYPVTYPYWSIRCSGSEGTGAHEEIAIEKRTSWGGEAMYSGAVRRWNAKVREMTGGE